MTSIADVLPILIGSPVNDYQSNLMYLFSGIITVVCILFFLKLFLLIGGYLSPNSR